ncbi:MAG: hypothetical protein JWQ38_1781 [Flavipsychrobacter sp.]|nr:hypothetical protein [Flavipsychrobacter sp.]
MHLRTTAKGIYGYYSYTSKNVPIPLHSDKSENKIKLIEGQLYEDDVFFEGKIAGDVFKGNWVDKNNKISFPFVLTHTGTETIAGSNSTVSGNYTHQDKALTKELQITSINNSYLYFDLSVGSPDCAILLIDIAKITTPGKAVFSDARCKQVSFSFSTNTANITEKDCEAYDGYNCPFAGKYHMQK